VTAVHTLKMSCFFCVLCYLKPSTEVRGVAKVPVDMSEQRDFVTMTHLSTAIQLTGQRQERKFMDKIESYFLRLKTMKPTICACFWHHKGSAP